MPKMRSFRSSLPVEEIKAQLSNLFPDNGFDLWTMPVHMDTKMNDEKFSFCVMSFHDIPDAPAPIIGNLGVWASSVDSPIIRSLRIPQVFAETEVPVFDHLLLTICNSDTLPRLTNMLFSQGAILAHCDNRRTQQIVMIWLVDRSVARLNLHVSDLRHTWYQPILYQQKVSAEELAVA